MLKELNMLKERLNGPLSEEFLYSDQGCGQYLNEDVVFVFGEEAYTLSFAAGKVQSVREGRPAGDAPICVAGTMEAWREFVGHGIFSMAISPRHGGKLKLTGRPLTVQGNLCAIGYVSTALAGILAENGENGGESK